MTRRAIKHRAMDGMNRTDNEVLEVLSSMLGLPLGDADNGIWYIQDEGYKMLDHCFVDANNMKLYRCIQGTTSTSNTTAYFAELNLTNHSDRLDNLGKIQSRKVSYVLSNQETSSLQIDDLNVTFYKIGNRALLYLCGYVTKGVTPNRIGYMLRPSGEFPIEFTPDTNYFNGSIIHGTYEHFTAEFNIGTSGEIFINNGSNSAVSRSWIIGLIEYVPHFR